MLRRVTDGRFKGAYGVSSRAAWDVLRRRFRPGMMAPHIPQEHFCDKPVTLADKRANIISGSAEPEAAASICAWIKQK